jgi:hypothetical protein
VDELRDHFIQNNGSKLVHVHIFLVFLLSTSILQSIEYILQKLFKILETFDAGKIKLKMLDKKIEKYNILGPLLGTKILQLGSVQLS